MISVSRRILIFLGCIILLYVVNMTSTWIRPQSSQGRCIKRSDTVKKKDTSSLLAAQQEDMKYVPFSALLADYHKQLKALNDGGYWKPSAKRQPCDDKRKNSVCTEKECNGTLTFDPEKSLKSIMRSMKDLDLDTLTEVTRLLRPKHNHKRVLFVTAASSNHYEESQAYIHNLRDYVFPHLTNYSFVYYDLGLTLEQRSELEQFCGCEVRTFPMSMMPSRLRNLDCYTWKPFIINANLPTTDTLIWTDSSVRFKNRTILDLLQLLEKTKFSAMWDHAPIAYHTLKAMFDYFEEETCSFSHVSEVLAGFSGYKNDRFVRNALVKPWTACALSPHCMCLNNSMSFVKCRGAVWRKYNHCHRFDQSALGIILVKLFRDHEVNFKIPYEIADVRRGDGADYFDKLRAENNIKLFKSFT